MISVCFITKASRLCNLLWKQTR